MSVLPTLVPVTFAAAKVLLNSSVKPLNISSENDANFTVASSNAACAPTELVFLVTEVNFVVVIPSYVNSSVPITSVPELGKPAVESTTNSLPERLPVPIAPLSCVLGCFVLLFK